MKISIITVCYNSAKTIGRTIKSVLAQKNVELEYLIIDGASKDNTVAIAESFKSQFAGKNVHYVIQSEPDKGIYDAMNKGVAMATGDVIGILNSDDWYAGDDVLESVCKTLEKSDVESCFGNLLYVKTDNEKIKPFRYWKSGKSRTFKYGWMPPHPAFFVKAEVYKKYGTFRLDCGTAADYELLLRFFEKCRISSVWINKTFVYMEAGGASGASVEAYKKSHRNDIDAWSKNGLKASSCMAWFKKIRKLPQFITAKFIKV